MPLDIAFLKIRLGIEDNSQDVALESIAAQAQALAEDYCDRKFDLEADEEAFDEAPPGSILVRRWPIVSIEAIDAGGVLVGDTRYRVDKAAGIIRGYSTWNGWSGWGRPPITVNYTGGFEPWPIGLAWAITELAEVLWYATPGAGADPGSGAGAGSGTGEVKRYSVPGAYTVELDVGESSSASSGGGGQGGAQWGIIPPNVTAALDSYRRESRIGIG